MKTFKSKLHGVFKSWTIWTNGVLLALTPFFQSISEVARDVLPGVAQWFTPSQMQHLVIIILIANLALRFKTNKGLEDK